MQISFPSLSSRRAVVLAAGAIAVGAFIWCALWGIAALQYRGVLDTWIETGRAEGYRISYDRREMFGFPRRVVTRFTGLRWINADGIAFRADTIDIGAFPWRWRRFTATFKGHVALEAPIENDAHALTIACEYGQAEAEISRQGLWLFSRIGINAARVGVAPDYLFAAESLSASARRPEDPPRGHGETGLTVTGAASGVTLPASIATPFGPKMAVAEAELRVMGAVPDFRRRPSVAAWNHDSGVVEFDRLRLGWGPVNLDARGTMGFDDDLQPEGAFAGALAGYKEVLKALVDYGSIAPRQEAMLNSALNLFARPARADGHKGIEMPITVQLGGLFLGPVKVFAFPEIVWPEAPEAHGAKAGDTP